MFSGPEPILRIDGDAVAANLALVRGRIASRGLIAVLKDNAYGHGMLPVGRVLAENGVDRFGVGSVAEATALQAGGVTGRMLNMRLFATREAGTIVSHGLAQTVWTDAHLRVLTEAARHAGRRALVHVKIDTGLRRYGLPANVAAEFIARVRSHPDLVLDGVFSMLSEDPERDREQIRRFDRVRTDAGRGRSELWHLASSHGVLHRPDACRIADAVRPGCLLLGFPPDREAVEDLRPTVRLEAPVLGARTFAPGDRVGFGRGWRIERETRAAIIGIGLKHGLRESMANGGEVLLDGRRRPIRQVATDTITVELTDGTAPSRDASAVLLGRDGSSEIDLAEWARWMGATPYTALVALRSRIARRLAGDRSRPPTYPR